MEKQNVDPSVLVEDVENFEDVLASAEGHGFFSSLWSHKRWTPTSQDVLRASEMRVLKTVKSSLLRRQVPISNGNFINTVIAGQGPPLVLIHGFGGGVGIWVANIDYLAKHFTVYACDLLGFGRSSRPAFKGTSADEGEEFFLSAMKEWADALGLKKFTLLGHSMGGFLAGLFAIRWPERLDRLILADPWGVPTKPDDLQKETSLRWRAVRGLVELVKSPFTLLRAAGPLGQRLLKRVRPDLGNKFIDLLGSPDDFHSYVYHCNVQAPSGEHAFHAFTIPGAWSASPLAERLHLLPHDLPVHCIYGSDTWMDYPTMRNIQQTLPNSIEILLVPDAGHHVYIDNFSTFNRAVATACLSGTLADLIEEFADSQDLADGSDRRFYGR